MSSPLTLASVAVIAGLLGSAITSGIYFGKMEQLITAHERGLNAQDQHMAQKSTLLDTSFHSHTRCGRMLVSFSDLPQQVDFVDGTCYENDNFYIGWKGVLFQYGARAGTESVARIADLLEHQTLADLCRLLHGIFVLFIFDKRSTT
jgi:hypothetical protein